MHREQRYVECDFAVRKFRQYASEKSASVLRRRDYVKTALGYRPTMSEEGRERCAEDAQTIIDGVMQGEDIPPRLQEAACQLEDFIRAQERNREMAQAGGEAMREVMAQHAVELPAWRYCSEIKCFQPHMLGLIVGVSAGVRPEDKEAGREIWSGLERFERPSQLWSWWGMGLEDGHRPEVRPKHRQGLIRGYLGTPLRNQGDTYKRVYYARRARTEDTHPEWNDGKRNNDAMTVMLKKLLKYIWIAWLDPDTDKTVLDERLWGYHDAVTDKYGEKI